MQKFVMQITVFKESETLNYQKAKSMTKNFILMLFLISEVFLISTIKMTF